MKVTAAIPAAGYAKQTISIITINAIHMNQKHRQFLLPIALLAAVLVHPVFALGLLFAGGAPLGTSYTAMNPQTSAGIIAQAANDREQAWALKIILGAYTENVFAQYHIGPPGSGRAFIDQTDVRKIRGNKIFLTDVSQLGSEGAQGETERNGKEEKINPHEQALQVGRQWYGMGVTTVAQAETLVGSQWDKVNSPLLEQRVGLKKSNDMQMVLRESATSDNRVYPNYKTAVAALKSADTFQTSVITKAGTVLSGNGAIVAKLVKDAKRGNVEGYAFTGALDSFNSLYQDPTYQSVVSRTGADNGIITGKFTDWNGHIIHPLQIRLRGGKGSVGSPLLRRAFLGIAIADADTTVNAGVLTGGGAGYADANKYFEHFSGYAYTLTNGLAPILWTDASTPPTQSGSTLTGDGSGPWYVAIIDKTTGKYALFSYTGNTGATLTGVKRLGSSASSNIVTTLSGSAMSYSTATYNAVSNPITTAAGGGAQGLLTEATGVAQGSLIVEINRLGVPYADTFGLGEMAGICGYGFVPGAKAFFGRRTQQVGNHEKDVSVGFEFSFGCKAYVNVDNVPTNYVRISHAIPVDGLPAVA